MLRTAKAVLALTLLLAACGAGDADEEVATTTTEAPTTTATGVEDPAPTTAAAPADPLGGFRPAPFQWEGCGGGLECAALAVPLDWARPDGPTIDLAVTRVPARSGDPIGAVATNPGGPGASGNQMVAGGSPFTAEIADRFDTIGWDPRGVGGSAGLLCDQDVIEDFVNLDTDPDRPEEEAALDAGAEAVGASCLAGSGDLLPHVGTGSVARDLEAIRRAYGGPMGYVGFSYGTAIGLEYLELFGGAMEHGVVLDGVVDPTHTQTDILRGQAVAFEAVLDGVLADAGLADDYDELAARVEADPVDAGGDELEPGDLTTAAIYALYAPELHGFLVDGIVAALDGDGSALLDLAESYRNDGFGAYQAVSCIDSETPRGGAAWSAFAAELEDLAPRVGPAVANEMRPCAFWPVPATPINGEVVADGSGPVLVIGTTGDAATPVEQAERVAATLADGHLLVFEGEGHGAYFSSGCVQDAVAAYLLDRTVPPAGTRC